MRIPGLRAVLAAAAPLVLVLASGACGVDVPDEVADRATSTTVSSEAPTTEGTTTTGAPRSDDDLEQALLDNGYTSDEAECGAEALRDELDEDEVDEIIGAEGVDDIGERLATDFAEAIGGCLDEGSEPDLRPGGG